MPGLEMLGLPAIDQAQFHQLGGQRFVVDLGPDAGVLAVGAQRGLGLENLLDGQQSAAQRGAAEDR